ncbi:MAG: endopeptidase La [Pyrinomonadaceae bacterium]|nr:endopeptidase La [Pyrinomonadaceae bacterium]MCX7639949.1 endopeptidase La [Pyrinomonadaceae bacterium]MDW8304121.1 endopeptidase La [Acidobacteriota bacterium]
MNKQTDFELFAQGKEANFVCKEESREENADSNYEDDPEEEHEDFVAEIRRLLNSDDESEKSKNQQKEAISAGKRLELPVLPLRKTVIFPEAIVPLVVGRKKSKAAVEEAIGTEEKLLVGVTVKSEEDDGESDASTSDVYQVGILINIKKFLRSEDNIQLIVQGIERVRIIEWVQEEPFLKATVEVLPLPHVREPEQVEALKRNINDLIRQAFDLIPNMPPELRMNILSTADPLRLSYFLGSVLDFGKEQEQKMLEAETLDDLLMIVHAAIAREIEILQIRMKIASDTQSEIEKSQREYFLRQQLKQIKKELGEDEESIEKAEVGELRKKLETADLPEEVRLEAERELKRMEKLPNISPDYHVIRTYLEYILELPWNKLTEDKLDLEETRRILDEDHYGLEDVKERILEFLAVVKLRPDSKSPILCFVGPPGVGKTSLGMSIARALGRKFERISLGGMRDEAELRGHRRTYVGSMPGRIIQALRKCGVKNPVLILDEIDKLGMDFRGDPASALLEILDPAQNHSFRDNYINLPFDLSKVFFIATANQLSPIPMPLRDRMEIIQLSGYSEAEKLNIAKKYLIPRQIKENGLSVEQIEITEDAIRFVISSYTREAGVRQLERTIAKLVRKIAFRVARGEVSEKQIIDIQKAKELLGSPVFYSEEARKELPVGVATGMAWTEAGGEILFVEAALLPGGNGLMLTGHLGEVMKESAQAARSYLWSHAKDFGIDPELIKTNGVHLHVPAGAIPKDGPSAGVTMATALASIYTGKKVRSDTAMTGEITLSGQVLPIGGVKEKVLAAHRAGIKRVILPKKNESELENIPEDVRRGLEFVFVERIDDVIKAAFQENITQKDIQQESGKTDGVFAEVPSEFVAEK